MKLFTSLHSRDVFMKAYENFTASRLLNKTSIAQEYEELMLRKLKLECNPYQVKKITQMMKDI